ncbi:class I SAM-dependent methyltransferase [Bartonella sp. DGB1]|uniref:class I SAM-dependent methyltransferase n=1 Tax=Bartonella sp. DGB1 TaxID=3239807 RepID=UPI0035261508
MTISNSLAEQFPLILKTKSSKEYALLDSGNGRKLERYGKYIINRPEGQAIWTPELPSYIWQKADAIFTGNTEEEAIGRWHFPKVKLAETWNLSWNKLDFLGRFTSFRHVGVFPEQAAHWFFLEKLIKNTAKPPKVLNLFAYTGIASLVAARAGAEVTHVDASKKAIGWAKENQIKAGMEQAKIRWICDDALSFCKRELRRNKNYDIILLDPPAYGRGPKGEVWQLFDHLKEMLILCKNLLSADALSLILTAYSIRASFLAMHELNYEIFQDKKGIIESGELIIETENSRRCLSTSLFSRWISNQQTQILANK